MRSLPEPGTKTRDILDAMPEFGTITLDELAGKIPHVARKQITTVVSAFQLITEESSVYVLPDILRRQLRNEVIDENTEALPLVEPRFVDLLHRPAMSNYEKTMRAAACRRPDAGQIDERSHYSGQAVAEPKINGAIL